MLKFGFVNIDKKLAAEKKVREKARKQLKKENTASYKKIFHGK